MPKLDTEQQLAAKNSKSLFEMNAGQCTVNNICNNPLFADEFIK